MCRKRNWSFCVRLGGSRRVFRRCREASHRGAWTACRVNQEGRSVLCCGKAWCLTGGRIEGEVGLLVAGK
ncbi:hypothetical protein B0T16DRAFT_395802 [Cercophora newfieldiana]|uniref:Uncharacterized protein n=1 Tax=Cercophora newfieldiana TaxID=92897 RepID=A0AA39YNL4_9PEZI|nr:hypothetical protein B0T16DRAFT_395802 [Cercophora newfieldiana]